MQMKTLKKLSMKLLLPTLLLASPIAFGQVEAKMDMICVTEFPTTSFIVEQNQDWVSVRVLHHNGPQYAPISNSLITLKDLEALKVQAEFIQSLGNQMDLKWKRSACNADRSDYFQCVGGAEDAVINKISIHPWALTVTEVEEKTLWGTYKKKNVSLRFSTGADSTRKDFQITMDYSEGDCVKSGVKKIPTLQ